MSAEYYADAVRPRMELGIGAVGDAEGSVEADVDDEEVAENGARKCVHVKDPCKPSEAEVREHELTHLPYRSWCRRCVRGRGKELPRKRSQEEVDMHELLLDWAFPGEEAGGQTLKVLVGRLRGIRMSLSTIHLTKTNGEFVIKSIMAFLRECGCEIVDLTVKTDQENIMVAMAEDLAKARAKKGSMRTVIEHSPIYQSRSNGIIERAVQSVEGQMRVLRSALDEKLGVGIPVGHPIWPWITEYSSFLLNRFEVGKDGKTAYERTKGKKANVYGVEFGEAALGKQRPMGGGLGKLACLWQDGVYLGIKGSTGEFIVADVKGIHRTRTIQRKPIEERWRTDNLALVRDVPWRKSDDDPNVDGDEWEARPLTELEKERLTTRFDIANKPAIRRFKIGKQDIEHHGVTQGCKGCKAVVMGRSKREHSEQCRARFEAALKDGERVKTSKRREGELYARLMEESEEKKRSKLEPENVQMVALVLRQVHLLAQAMLRQGLTRWTLQKETQRGRLTTKEWKTTCSERASD